MTSGVGEWVTGWSDRLDWSDWQDRTRTFITQVVTGIYEQNQEDFKKDALKLRISTKMLEGQSVRLVHQLGVQWVFAGN